MRKLQLKLGKKIALIVLGLFALLLFGAATLLTAPITTQAAEDNALSIHDDFRTMQLSETSVSGYNNVSCDANLYGLVPGTPWGARMNGGNGRLYYEIPVEKLNGSEHLYFSAYIGYGHISGRYWYREDGKRGASFSMSVNADTKSSKQFWKIDAYLINSDTSFTGDDPIKQDFGMYRINLDIMDFFKAQNFVPQEKIQIVIELYHIKNTESVVESERENGIALGNMGVRLFSVDINTTGFQDDTVPVSDDFYFGVGADYNGENLHKQTFLLFMNWAKFTGNNVLNNIELSLADSGAKNDVKIVGNTVLGWSDFEDVAGTNFLKVAKIETEADNYEDLVQVFAKINYTLVGESDSRSLVAESSTMSVARTWRAAVKDNNFGALGLTDKQIQQVKSYVSATTSERALALDNCKAINLFKASTETPAFDTTAELYKSVLKLKNDCTVAFNFGEQQVKYELKDGLINVINDVLTLDSANEKISATYYYVNNIYYLEFKLPDSIFLSSLGYGGAEIENADVAIVNDNYNVVLDDAVKSAAEETIKQNDYLAGRIEQLEEDRNDLIKDVHDHEEALKSTTEELESVKKDFNDTVGKIISDWTKKAFNWDISALTIEIILLCVAVVLFLGLGLLLGKIIFRG